LGLSTVPTGMDCVVNNHWIYKDAKIFLLISLEESVEQVWLPPFLLALVLKCLGTRLTPLKTF
ncbi:MAG: hypothetical protein ACRCSI_12105, partial [Eubacterium aggregans]